MAIFSIQFTPLIISSASNCILWMRPDDTSLSNMTFSSNRLSAIKNLANNRVLINNGTTANQPSTGLVTINGLNAIGFDNDNNRWLNIGISTLTNFTIFVVAQQVVSATQGILFGGGGSNQMRMTTGNTGFNTTDGTTTLSITAGASVLTAPAIFAITANVSTSTRNLYKNSATAGITGAYDGSFLGTSFGASSASAGNARGGFSLGESIIYNKALSAAEITTIMRYLANRWGVILT